MGRAGLTRVCLSQGESPSTQTTAAVALVPATARLTEIGRNKWRKDKASEFPQLVFLHVFSPDRKTGKRMKTHRPSLFSSNFCFNDANYSVD